MRKLSPWRQTIVSLLIFLLLLAVGVFNVFGLESIPSSNPDLIRLIGWVIVYSLLFWQSIQPQRELNKLKTSLPKIEAKRPYIDSRFVIVHQKVDSNGIPIKFITNEDGTITPVSATMDTIGLVPLYYHSQKDVEVKEYLFAHIPFYNKPEFPSESSWAKGVVATISFYNSKMEPVLTEIKGRWAEREEPNKLSPNQIKRDLYEVDFAPNQLPWELDIAMKSPKEKIGFAFNNDSYEFIEFKNEDMILNEDKYFVKITLRGEGLNPKDDPFCFVLFIKDGNGDFSIFKKEK